MNRENILNQLHDNAFTSQRGEDAIDLNQADKVINKALDDHYETLEEIILRLKGGDETDCENAIKMLEKLSADLY